MGGFSFDGGAVLGGAISALGGVLGASDSNQHAAAMAAQQAALQKEYAQNAIQWKVSDAKKAGLHPLAAMGISTASYSPVSSSYSSPFSGLQDFGRSLGQSFDRAREAGLSEEQRAKAENFSDAQTALTLKNQELQNEILQLEVASRRATLHQQAAPPAPPLVDRRMMPGQTGSGFADTPPPLSRDVEEEMAARNHDVGNKWQWLRDGEGGYMFAASEGYNQLFEDKPILEYLPTVEAALKHVYGRFYHDFTGEPFHGMVFDSRRGSWIPALSGRGREITSDQNSDLLSALLGRSVVADLRAGLRQKGESYLDWFLRRTRRYGYQPDGSYWGRLR